MLRTRASITTSLTAFVLLGLGLQLRYGYRAGVDDHLVLSPKGIQLSNPDAFVNDYFLQNAPQPHIAFDAITYLGERTGLLGFTYLAYWLVALLALSVAISLMILKLGKTNFIGTTTLAVVFLVLAPISFLGTTTPALARAIPHVMGGSLALLTISLLIFGKVRWAGAVAFLAAVMHVQNGLIAAAVVLLWLIITFVINRSVDAILVLETVLAFAVVFAILKLRPIAGNPEDFLFVCREYIPYHCEADTWVLDRLATGIAGLTLVALLASSIFAERLNKVTATFVRVLVAGLVFANLFVVFADRYNVPVLGELFQATNAYRIGVLTVGLASISFALHLSLISSLSKKHFYVAVVSGVLFLNAPSDGGYLSNMKIGLLAVGLFLILVKHAIDRKQIDDSQFSLPVSQSVVIPFTGFIAATLSVLALAGPSFTFGLPVLSFNSARADLGKQIASVIPSGETIAMDPKRNWVRLSTERAVVVDCKYVPYGGPALLEYRKRLDQLGGFGNTCGLKGFSELKPIEVSEFAQKFDANYLLLTASDVRLDDIKEIGWDEIERIPYSNTTFVILRKE